MSKIKRTASAFAQRVKMSGQEESLFIFVEGKGHDRAFYDRILASHPKAQEIGYHLMLVEEVKLDDGKSGGGKQFAYQLFDFFEERDELSHRNSSGLKEIVFMLDRDFEHLALTARAHSNIIYTNFADVEAEILLNGDLQRGLESAFSVDGRRISEVLASVNNDPARKLAEIWREWITILVVVSRCGIGLGVHHAGLSAVNSPKFGAVNTKLLTELKAELHNQIAITDNVCIAGGSEQRVDEIYRASYEARLLKGKWIEAYLHHLVRDVLDDVPISSNTAKDLVTKCCMVTLDFTEHWADHFRSELSNLEALRV